MNRALRIAAILMTFVSLGVAAYFGGKIYATKMEYANGDQSYEELAQKATESDESQAPFSKELAEELEKEEVPVVDLEKAKELNGDITAWLYNPDTVINYPVCYGEDNKYYLTHLADGKYNRNGCLFIDCNNEKDFSDKNTLIYGHHMDSGAMFASLVKYKKQDYYDEHPVMYLTVKNALYKLELFSSYVTASNSSAYTKEFATDADYTMWIKTIAKQSDFQPGPMVLSKNDRIVTLSTCVYDFQNARYVVHGRLTKIGGYEECN